MQITMPDGLVIDYENASTEARQMVDEALSVKRDDHKKQVNQFIEAVFFSSMKQAVESEIKLHVKVEVQKFFLTKEGRASIARATKIICDDAVSRLTDK